MKSDKDVKKLYFPQVHTSPLWLAGGFDLWQIKAGCSVSEQKSPMDTSLLRTMKRLCGVTLILTLSLSYYIYMPLPATVSEPWKLMLVGATFRTATHLVRKTIN